MFRKGLLLVIVIGSIIFMSCAGKTTYLYNNVGYDAPEQALAAQKANLDAYLDKITPMDHPLGSSAIVILPSISYITKNWVVWRGPEPSQETKEKHMNYLAQILYNDYRAFGHAVEKRRIFNSLKITTSDDPENVTFSEDIALLLFKKDGKGQWFLKKKKDSTSDVMAIEEISTALPTVQRVILWLDSVEKLSRP